MTTQILAPNFYIDQVMDSTDAVRELKQASHMLFGSPGDMCRLCVSHSGKATVDDCSD